MSAPSKAALAEAAPHFHGHRERLRERFLAGGAAALADYELLELVLFRAIPRRDVKPLAKELIKTFGSLAEVISAPPARLREAGLGEASVTDIKIIAAAAHALTRGQVMDRQVLSSWSEVLDYCRAAMAFGDKEQLRVLFLDKRNHLIADERLQEGTVDHTPVYPREVVKRGSSPRHRDRAGAQPSRRRPVAVARRHCNDPDDRRRSEAARHRGARSHHRRQGRAREFEGAEADLTRQTAQDATATVLADALAAFSDGSPVSTSPENVLTIGPVYWTDQTRFRCSPSSR